MAGDARAYLFLGQFYDEGSGTEKSEMEALRWYKKAHRSMHDEIAANNIACILRDRGEISRALWWFRRAIQLGNEGAHLGLAKLLLKRGAKTTARRHLTKVVDGTRVTECSREQARRLLGRLRRE